MDVKDVLDKEAIYLPLDKAILFLEEKQLFSDIAKIQEIQKKYHGTRQSRNIRKGLVIESLEKNNLFNEFCNRYWLNGLSKAGISIIRTYKSNLNYINDFDNEEVDIETDNNEIDLPFEETSFAYEADLRDYLANNLHLIEPGLKLFIDEKGIEGVEYPVDQNNKRIDILAVDKDNNPVVIELKVSKGYEKVIGQCQYYKNRIREKLSVEKVRVIIIAREITSNLRIAVSDLDNVDLFEYQLNIKLNKIK